MNSAGNSVDIDPLVCAGCGSCASVCPTGAASYQLPAGDSLFERLRTLLGAYREADGKRATLLLHDARHGSEMIGIMARFGRRSEEHTSELQSLMRISYAVFCLKKKNKKIQKNTPH